MNRWPVYTICSITPGKRWKWFAIVLEQTFAVIGWAGPVDWYAKRVGATLIPNSEPGPFRGRLEGSQ